MPDWKSLVRARLGDLSLDPARASDVVDELAQHVAQHYADLTASWVDAPPRMSGARTARRSRACRRRDRARRPSADDGAGAAGGDGVAADRSGPRHPIRRTSLLARTGLRRRRPADAFALGIGANTAIFSAERGAAAAAPTRIRIGSC
jgi:hypothetical protein